MFSLQTMPKHRLFEEFNDLQNGLFVFYTGVFLSIQFKLVIDEVCLCESSDYLF